jgi:hypothetical protein
MNLIQQGRKVLTALTLVLVLMIATACEAIATKDTQASYPARMDRSAEYGQLARGNSVVGQDFGNWVVETSRGLIKDAYVRDNNKLGVVISPQVRPTEVKDLAKSLAQGFRQNFPDQDLTVLMYAPDKDLILTARYDAQTKQIEYQQAS